MDKALYEYVIIKQEKLDKDGDIVDQAEILAGPDSVLAATEEEARIYANRAIPDDAMSYLDRITVGVRPFDNAADLAALAQRQSLAALAGGEVGQKMKRLVNDASSYGLVATGGNVGTSGTWMHTHTPATYTQADVGSTTAG